MGWDQLVYREITGSKEKDSSVRSDIGNQWYLHVLADLVNEKVLCEEEFANFFQNYDGNF